MASSFTLERRTYSFPKENVFVLKRKNFDDSEKQNHTGRNIALGLLGTAALGAGGFAGARRGMFGGAAQMTTNRWWNKLGQRFNNEGMITSSIEKHAQGFEAAAKKNPAKYADTTAAKMAEEAGMAKNLEHAEQLKAAKKAEDAVAEASKATQAAAQETQAATQTSATTQNATQATQAATQAAAQETQAATQAAAQETNKPGWGQRAKGFFKRVFRRNKGGTPQAVPTPTAETAVKPPPLPVKRNNYVIPGEFRNTGSAGQVPKGYALPSGMTNKKPPGSIMGEVRNSPSPKRTTPPQIPAALDPTLAAQARQNYTSGFTSFHIPRVTEAAPKGGSPLDNPLVQSIRGQVGMGAPNPQYTQTWNLNAIQG